jgi:hypothetical protein
MVGITITPTIEKKLAYNEPQVVICYTVLNGFDPIGTAIHGFDESIYI